MPYIEIRFLSHLGARSGNIAALASINLSGGCPIVLAERERNLEKPGIDPSGPRRLLRKAVLASARQWIEVNNGIAE